MPPAAAPQDKTKDWQLEILMEKLRSKSSQYKSFGEISKNVRMAMLDKRYALDSVEKSQHQKCLDTLQHSIKVTSLQSMIERLESLTRQLGLKFMVGPTGVELFISSDMFYLEIMLDQTGAVKDVKVHHEGKVEQQSCQELVGCLSRGDFSDFTAQLEGFASIYQLNAEKKIKCKAFTALQCLESDLSTLAQVQQFMKEPFNLFHKSPVGVLEKRKGGHPMKLTYFVSPYDLLNTEKCDMEALNIEMIISKSLGYSVTVCMEGSATHKLQTTSLISVNRNVNGKSIPSFSPHNTQNSAAIPACFVLKLNKPMPLCSALVHEIQQSTELDTMDQFQTHPLLGLIVHHSSEGKMESGDNKGLFVTLPDQNHCYFMTENKNMDGILVTSVPFTHPSQVSTILNCLRRQALFNSIISSCVRPNSKQDFENMTMLEISALSWTHISISLEHPSEESMATAEIDLSDIASLVCKIRSPGTPPPSNAPDPISELATRILNKSFSIPITMRAVIKQWEKQVSRRSHYNGHENFSLPLGSGDPGGHKGGSGGNGLENIKQEPQGQSGNGNGHGGFTHQGMFLNESMMASANFQGFPPSEGGVLSNIELANILTGGGGGGNGSNSASENKSKRHKRKASDEWKSKTELIESSSSDSTSRSTPISQEMEIATPNSLGFQSDLELSSLDPNELLGSGAGDNKEFAGLDELGDVEEMLAGPSRRKSRDQKSPNSLMLDLGEKNLVSPSVSITPIPSNSPGFQGSDASKRPGIEIIPIATTANVTITPIKSSDDKNRSDKKKSSRSSDEKSRLEKKRKRKRDESPMGPPEKVPPKQDALNKPVSVSIKPTESPPPTSPGAMIRKFNTSPTHNRGLSGKLSPSLANLKSGSSHHSPKHSPAHVPSSPKIPGMSSPKSHGTSPKHPSTSGSGKPSMSTLKSAASSPKSSEKSKSKSESSRDKDKKLGVFNVNKTKSSVKVKPLDLNADLTITDSLPSPSGDISKNQVRNRKGSLSAIVDKLKSAQCDGVDLTKSKDRPVPSTKSNDKKPENKNSEYMVKPSSDGIKITINKTRSKDSKGLSKSGSGSPKIHTGLKPGVNSGPASKKPGHVSSSSSSSSSSTQKPVTSTSTGSSNSSIKKVSSSSSSSSSSAPVTKPPSSSVQKPKVSSSSSSSDKISDAKNKDRPKVKTDKVFKDGRKSSPTQDADSVYKIVKEQNFTMDLGLMKLDTKFQIPKLSARTGDDKKKTENNRNADGKIFDMTAKPPNKVFDNSRNNIVKKDEDEKKPSAEQPQNLTQQQKDLFTQTALKSIDLTSKFVAPAAPKDMSEKKEIKSNADALDFSASSKEVKVATSFPQSPSVSVHIVKSPAPSPLINPSPHSASPCITDDELMDEALIGMGGK